MIDKTEARQPAYDAVFAYIRSQARDFMPTTVVERNAIIWRAVNAALDAMGAPSGPAATQATEPHTGLVVQPYRNDRGDNVWVFRCWGTDTCDGWLSLDHTSQQSATRARDRHVTEEHPSGQPAPVDTAHRYCILCGGQTLPGHTCDPAGLRTVYRGLADRAEQQQERADAAEAKIAVARKACQAVIDGATVADALGILEAAKEQPS